MPRPCGYCSGVGHSAFNCPRKPRKPLVTKARLNQLGKQGKKTAAAVAKWKKTVKPNHQGRYECYICHTEVDYLMAEHVKSKARHPELRTELNNLKPVCADCNAAKGSKDN